MKRATIARRLPLFVLLIALLAASCLLAGCGYDKEAPAPTMPPATVISATEPAPTQAPPPASATPLPQPPQLPAQQGQPAHRSQDGYPYPYPLPAVPLMPDGSPRPTATPWVYPTP